MFADQMNTVAIVTYLSRPQMATLDFDEKSVYSLRGKKVQPWITCPRSARRNEAIATENHDAARIQRNQNCARLGSSVPIESKVLLSGH
jgi:hypothetical protein